MKKVKTKKIKEKKKKNGVWIPKTHYDQADVVERINLLVEQGATQELIDKWVHQLDAQYYSNDHKKPGGFWSSQDGYSTEIIDFATGHNGKEITMETYLNSLNNSRAACALNQNYKLASGKHINFKDKNDEVLEAEKQRVIEFRLRKMQEEENFTSRTTELEDLLEYNTLAEALTLVKEETINNILENTDEVRLFVNLLVRDVAILTQKAMPIHREQILEEKRKVKELNKIKRLGKV